MHTIREYTHADVDAVKHCLAELQEFERLIDAKRLQGLHIAHEYLEHLLVLCREEKGKIYVVEINGGVVGMISVVIEHDTRHMRKVRPFAVISDLMVLPEYRSEGVTKDLLEVAEAYAREKHVLSIQTHILADHKDGANGFLRHGYTHFELVLRKQI